MRHIALLAVFLACATTPPGPSPDPQEATCAGMCARMAALDCPAAQDTPNGATCVQVCENVQATGIARWDLECRVAAPTCEAIDNCEN